MHFRIYIPCKDGKLILSLNPFYKSYALEIPIMCLTPDNADQGFSSFWNNIATCGEKFDSFFFPVSETLSRHFVDKLCFDSVCELNCSMIVEGDRPLFHSTGKIIGCVCLAVSFVMTEKACLEWRCANRPGLLKGPFKGYSWLYHILLFHKSILILLKYTAPFMSFVSVSPLL